MGTRHKQKPAHKRSLQVLLGPGKVFSLSRSGRVTVYDEVSKDSEL